MAMVTDEAGRQLDQLRSAMHRGSYSAANHSPGSMGLALQRQAQNAAGNSTKALPERSR